MPRHTRTAPIPVTTSSRRTLAMTTDRETRAPTCGEHPTGRAMQLSVDLGDSRLTTLLLALTPLGLIVHSQFPTAITSSRCPWIATFGS
jgi:hypothetical protein